MGDRRGHGGLSCRLSFAAEFVEALGLPRRDRPWSCTSTVRIGSVAPAAGLATLGHTAGGLRMSPWLRGCVVCTLLCRVGRTLN